MPEIIEQSPDRLVVRHVWGYRRGAGTATMVGAAGLLIAWMGLQGCFHLPFGFLANPSLVFLMAAVQSSMQTIPIVLLVTGVAFWRGWVTHHSGTESRYT